MYGSEKVKIGPPYVMLPQHLNHILQFRDDWRNVAVKQTCDIDTLLVKGWSNVYNAGLTLEQYCYST